MGIEKEVICKAKNLMKIDLKPPGINKDPLSLHKSDIAIDFDTS